MLRADQLFASVPNNPTIFTLTDLYSHRDVARDSPRGRLLPPIQMRCETNTRQPTRTRKRCNR